jgi:hypothetical protein
MFSTVTPTTAKHSLEAQEVRKIYFFFFFGQTFICESSA